MQCLAGALVWCVMGNASAVDLFEIRISITENDGGTSQPYTVTDGTSNAEELIDILDDNNLRQLVMQQHPSRSFDGDERVLGTLNFRGVDVLLNYNDFVTPLGGGSTLVFAIPELEGLSETFDGESRRASLQAFKDFLKGNEGDIISQMYGLLAKRSPTDPIAGNPASAQSQVAQRDFQQAFTQKVSQVWGCSVSAAGEQIMLAKAGFGCEQQVADANFRWPAIEVAQLEGSQIDSSSIGLFDDYYEQANRARGENQAAIGLQYAQIKANNGSNEFTTTMFSLPLSYTVVFDSNPNRRLILSLPISLSDTEGAETYQFGFGVGYSHPLTSRWSLTPSVGYTVVGSEDLAAASALASFSVTSSYSFELGGWGFNLGNMLGSYSSQKLKVGDFESDPGISNTIMTNGLLVSGPSSLLANDLVLEYYINDTRYMGDDLFIDNAQEIGINIGKLSTQGEVVTSFLKAGISYMLAGGENDNEADVLRLSLVYKF